MSHAHNVRILYKLILRLHRSLPEELKVIGTKYAQDEFKRHRNCAPHEASIFMQEWSVSMLEIRFVCSFIMLRKILELCYNIG